MVPLLEGVFQVTSMTGDPMGYLSRMTDSDETFPRTMSLHLALRARFALFPDRQPIKILVIIVRYLSFLAVYSLVLPSGFPRERAIPWADLEKSRP